MKRYLLLLLIAVTALGASAQIEVLKGSFKQIGLDDVAAGQDLGKQNVTNLLTRDWPLDFDGNQPAALLRVKFLNLPDKEISGIKLRLSGGKNVVETKEMNVEGKPELWFFTDPGRNLDLTFSHSGALGMCALSGVTLESKKSYEVTISNKALVTVNFVTTPEGAKLYVDGEYRGNTPVKLELTMGQHNIGLINGKTQDNFTQMIDQGTTLVKRDLRPTREVTIKSQVKGADVLINGTRYGRTPLTVTLPYDTYQVTVDNGDGLSNTVAAIVDDMSGDIEVELFRTKTMSFIPRYANSQVSGVKLQITDSEGKSAVGTNFRDYISVPEESVTLPYGRYHVVATYNIPDGRGMTTTWEDNVTVNESTDPKRVFDLKTVRRGYNPFRIDYRHRTVGLSVRYVQKWYSYTYNAVHYKMNLGGNDRTMNGVQVGLPIQPYFGSGIGLGTGLYFEYYKTEVDYQKTAGEARTNNHLEDMQLYMPVHLQFRLPAAGETSFFISAGIGLTYGIKLKAQTEDDGWADLKYGEDGMPKAFNYAFEFGCGFRYRRLLIDFTYSMGLTKNQLVPAIDNVPAEKVDAKMNKLAAGIGLLF